jgi:hypothetical protein
MWKIGHSIQKGTIIKVLSPRKNHETVKVLEQNDSKRDRGGQATSQKYGVRFNQHDKPLCYVLVMLTGLAFVNHS